MAKISTEPSVSLKFLTFNSAILFSSGLSLQENSNKYIKLIRFIILFFATVHGIYEVKRNLVPSNHHFRIFYSFLWFLSISSINLFFILRKNRLIEFAKSLLILLSPNRRKKIENIARNLVVVNSCYILFKMVPRIIRDYKDKDNILLGISTVVFHEFLVKTCLVYLSFVYLLFSYVFQVLKEINSSDNIKFIYFKLQEILLLLRFFDHLFSFLPLVLLIHQFMVIVIVLIFIGSEYYLAFYGCLIAMIHNLILIFLLVVITRMKRFVGKELFIIEAGLAMEHGLQRLPVLMSSIMSRIESISCFELTAWSLFPLNTTLILKFVCHLMTFSIMFINIEM